MQLKFPQGKFAVWRSPRGKWKFPPCLEESPKNINRSTQTWACWESPVWVREDPCQWIWPEKRDRICCALLPSIPPPGPDLPTFHPYSVTSLLPASPLPCPAWSLPSLVHVEDCTGTDGTAHAFLPVSLTPMLSQHALHHVCYCLNQLSAFFPAQSMGRSNCATWLNLERKSFAAQNFLKVSLEPKESRMTLDGFAFV